VVAENTTGEEQAVWIEKLERIKVLIARISNLKPQIW
jgi:hypothetical protein